MPRIDGINRIFDQYKINNESKIDVSNLALNIKRVAISSEIPLSSIQSTSQNSADSIPKIAHFHLYLTPTTTQAGEQNSANVPSDKQQQCFTFENTPTDRKYSINILNAFRNIIDFVEKNRTHQVCLWTDDSSEKIIKKIALDNEISPVLFQKITLCDIHKFFDNWNYNGEQKSLLYKVFRQEMTGPGKNLAAAKDIAQYAVLEAFGGLGIDCDVAAKKAISNLATPSGIRIFLTDQKGSTPMISNALIAAKPHHSTIQKTIEHINHTYLGNWHDLPELKVNQWRSCSIYLDYQPEMQELTQQESFALLLKNINIDKRFDTSPKRVGGTKFNSAKVGLTVAATGPGALHCGMGRTIGIKHNLKDYRFENNNEIFGLISDSVKPNDRFTASRKNIIQDKLQDDGKSWNTSTTIKRRGSF